MNLELNNEECAILADVLDSAFRNLKEEINKTEAYEYKQQLKSREEVLSRLLIRLNPSAMKIT